MGETKYETKNSTGSFISRTGDAIALPDDILITISAGRGLPSAITTPWDAMSDDVMATVFAELRY